MAYRAKWSRADELLRDSAVDAEVNERSSQRLRKTPGNAPPVNGQKARLSRASSLLGARPVCSADSISPDGTQQKSVWARVSNEIHRIRRVEAKKMRSVRASAPHLPDVMVVDLAVRSIITMLYLHACSPLLQHPSFF